MNTQSLIATAALSLFAATGAFAAEGTQDFTVPQASNLTRAEVKADLSGAQRAGKLESGEGAYTVAPSSKLTRAQVIAEAREAQRLGLIGPSESTPVATKAQLEQIRIAGERAASTVTATTR